MKKALRQFYEVYIREFMLVKSDAGVMIFLFLLPVAYPVIYSLIYNPELVREVAVVAVDNDRSAQSRELVRKLDATQGMHMLGYAANLGEARRAVNTHEAYAILEIPEGFGRKTGTRQQAEAVFYCDMSLLLRYRAILVGATDVMSEMGGQLTTQRIDQILPMAETITTGDLMPINNIQMGNIQGGFDSFIMPGVLMLILQQSIVLAVGMAGGAKRERPSLIGYNPINESRSPLMTMLGQMACYITCLIVPIIFLVHYVPLIFAFPMAGSTWEIFMFVVPYILASCCLGFFIQGIVRERESIFVIWVATSIIFLFLSGLTWPRFAMPKPWLVVSDIVPATWAVEGFIRMNANGASLAQVRPDYISLWLCVAGYGLAGYLVQRFVMRPAIRAKAIEIEQTVNARQS